MKKNWPILIAFAAGLAFLFKDQIAKFFGPGQSQPATPEAPATPTVPAAPADSAGGGGSSGSGATEVSALLSSPFLGGNPSTDTTGTGEGKKAERDAKRATAKADHDAKVAQNKADREKAKADHQAKVDQNKADRQQRRQERQQQHQQAPREIGGLNGPRTHLSTPYNGGLFHAEPRTPTDQRQGASAARAVHLSTPYAPKPLPIGTHTHHSIRPSPTNRYQVPPKGPRG